MWQPPPLPRTLTAALRDLDDPAPAVRASALRGITVPAAAASTGEPRGAGADWAGRKHPDDFSENP